MQAKPVDCGQRERQRTETKYECSIVFVEVSPTPFHQAIYQTMKSRFTELCNSCNVHQAQPLMKFRQQIQNQSDALQDLMFASTNSDSLLIFVVHHHRIS